MHHKAATKFANACNNGEAIYAMLTFCMVEG